MNSRRFSWSNCICRPSQGLPWQHTALARIKLGAHCSAGFDPAHDRSGSNSAFQRSSLRRLGMIGLVPRSYRSSRSSALS
jgi:hypothetical protein